MPQGQTLANRDGACKNCKFHRAHLLLGLVVGLGLLNLLLLVVVLLFIGVLMLNMCTSTSEQPLKSTEPNISCEL